MADKKKKKKHPAIYGKGATSCNGCGKTIVAGFGLPFCNGCAQEHDVEPDNDADDTGGAGGATV